MKLQTKISVWVLLIFVVSGVATTWLVLSLQRETNVAQFAQLSEALAQSVLNSLKQDMLNARREDIQPMVRNMRRGPLINEITIFSGKGNVAFSSNPDERGQHIGDRDLAAVLRTGKRRTRYEFKYGSKEFCILMPVPNERACVQCHGAKARVLGVVEVGLRTEPLSRYIESDTRALVITQLVGLLVMLVAVTALIRRTVVARLGNMLASIRKIAGGTFSERVKVDTRDEVGELGEAFNEMQDTIETTIDELAKANEQLDRSLLRFGKLLSTTLNIEEMANLILNELADSVDSSEACLFLRQEKTDALLLLASRGVFKEVVTEYNAEPVVWGQPPYTPSTFRSKAMLLGTEEERQSVTDIARCHGQRSFYAFSLMSADKVVGLLTLVPSDDGLPEARIHTLQALCHEAATGVEAALMHEQLAVVSITDALTQTYNQRHFFAVLREEMERAKRYGGTFSIVFLDLDNFKLFNDGFGHLAGDTILRQVSALLSQLVRASDRVFRYGGDEFVLILPDTARESAIVLSNRIRDEVAHRDFLPPGKTAPFRLTVSVGVTSFDSRRFAREDDVFKAVDDALYQAKQGGRNRVVVG